MTVKGLYALQNGFMGAQRSLLFYGEYSEARTQIPITCYVVRTSDAVILFDTGVAPRAVPGLLRNDPFARFTDDDLLVHRLDGLDLEPANVDLVVISHLHYDHAGGGALFSDSELVVQKDEYAYAHYPAPFFAPFYYRKNFDLPGSRWRLLDGDTELVPGVTVLRTDGHTPGHQSLFVELPESGPRSEEHTSELQSRLHLVCRLLLEIKKHNTLHPKRQLVFHAFDPILHLLI